MSDMTDHELRQAKSLGYANGYQAGRRRLESDMASEARTATEREFWDAAFLAATPSFVVANGWVQGEVQLTSLDQRTQLAADWATKALKLRRKLAP